SRFRRPLPDATGRSLPSSRRPVRVSFRPQQGRQRDTAGPLRLGRLLPRCCRTDRSTCSATRHALLVTHQASSFGRHVPGRQRSARARGGLVVTDAALPVLSTGVSSLLMGLCFASSDLTNRPAARQNARCERCGALSAAIPFSADFAATLT